ncbi:DUF4340 domain-containing protein [Roseburia sp. 831b]|uniref:DUF4340 domain-containing protein n=1 Tax=Roseburia sp. 831b TaxID=1261635 RepID=UPI00095320D6|nr:DUF4340 domain-containing protein [Roseburia sp. 831b]WVK71689.1 DUF4340 domain-containing protein [Roseburia sp. 831b]
MQKQRKQFVITVVILLVLVLAYIGIHIYNQKQEEKKEKEEKENEITVTELDTDDMTAFSYQVSGETLSFTKDGDEWVYDQDTSLDLDEDVVNGMIEKAASLTADDSFDDYDSLADYGLDQPSNTITLTTKESTTTLYLGNQNAMTSQYYLMTGDGETVYAVDNTLSTTFSKTVDSLVKEEDTQTEEPEEAVTEETESVSDTEASVE